MGYRTAKIVTKDAGKASLGLFEISVYAFLALLAIIVAIPIIAGLIVYGIVKLILAIRREMKAAKANAPTVVETETAETAEPPAA
ncbi:MAG: hypothetical protein QM572_19485 [Nocardioides sp.]|uniref:hypothetical protein n=1 Tax=Nocardioides sp. TaxID=35761 RepID=UPI0039E41D06